MCHHVYTLTSSIGIRELRQRVSSVLRRVAAGEVVDVTDRGRPIARIVPLRHRVLDQLVLEGRASEAEGDLLELMDALHLPAAPKRKAPSPSDALADLRADER